MLDFRETYWNHNNGAAQGSAVLRESGRTTKIILSSLSLSMLQPCAIQVSL